MARENSLARFLIGLPMPGGVVLGAAWAIQQEPVVLSAAAPYALYFAVSALASAVLLCWYHDQSRLLSVTLAVALTLTALTRTSGNATSVGTLAMFLLPLNFALFAAWRDSAPGPLRGVPKLGIVFAQAAAVAWNDGALVHQFASVLQTRAAGTLAFTLAAAVILVVAFRRRSKVEQGLFWALAAMFGGVSGAMHPQALPLFTGAAGVVLVLTVLEHGDDLAYRDELTGLMGRRAFNMMGGLGRTYAIAICDVDHFKEFNDTYGHEAGDQVLRMVASKLSQVGGGGRVFRYGGEEFLVVFRGRATAEAAPFAEAVRKAIADTAFILRGPDRPARKPWKRADHDSDSPRAKTSVRITVSIGLADRSQRHSTPELVLEAADAALYQAKQSGRNCLKLAEGTQNAAWPSRATQPVSAG